MEIDRLILDDIRDRLERLDALLDSPEYGDDLLMVCMGADPCVLQANVAAGSSVKILTPTAENDFTIAITKSEDGRVMERVVLPLQLASKICDLTSNT